MRWRLGVWGLAVGCLILYLTGANGYDLFTDDEIRYAMAGRRMLETGDWVIPEFNGCPRYQKPILFYWLQAISMAIFGPKAWAARVPSALAGTGVVLMTAQLGKALWGQRVGLWSGVTLALSGGMMVLSRMVMIDMVLLLFLQGGLTCFCLAQLTDDQQQRRCLYSLMYACLALGVLTKGLIAILLPIAIIAPWLLIRGEFWQTFRRARPLEGLVLLVLLAGPWYILAHLRSHGEFTQHFLFHEHVNRLISNVNRRPQSAAYYLLLIIPMTIPWCGILPQALRAGIQGLARKVHFAEAAPWFFVWQIVLVHGLFTLSQTKGWHYALPALPPLALLIGRWLVQQLRQPTLPGRSPLLGALSLLGVTSLALALAGQFSPSRLLPTWARTGELLMALRTSFWVLLALSTLLLVLHRFTSLRVTLSGLVCGAAIWYLVVSIVVVPQLDRVMNQPSRDLAEWMKRYPDATAVTYRLRDLGLNFQTRHAVIYHWGEDSLTDLIELLDSERPVFVMTRQTYRHDLDGLRFHVWGEDSRLVYGANLRPGEDRQELSVRGPVTSRMNDQEGLNGASGPRTMTEIQPCNSPPIGSLDVPSNGATVSGVVDAGGWALDRETSTERLGLTLLVDGVAVSARVSSGLDRPDVCAIHPESTFPGACRSGFRSEWDATGLSGSHTVAIRVRDGGGRSRVLGPSTVKVIAP